MAIINSDFKNISNFIKFGHINAVTVHGNKDEIEQTLIEACFDLFVVTETNLLPNTPKNAIEIPNYKLFSIKIGKVITIQKDVAGYIGKKELKTSTLKLLKLITNTKNLKDVRLRLLLFKVKVSVITVYNSPSTDYKVFSQIFETLQFLLFFFYYFCRPGDRGLDGGLLTLFRVEKDTLGRISLETIFNSLVGL